MDGRANTKPYGVINAFQRQLTQQRIGISLVTEQSRVQDRKDGPLKGSPVLQELACCSYQLKILSCLQSENKKPEHMLSADKTEAKLHWCICIRISQK